jgi:hypothetical protein
MFKQIFFTCLLCAASVLSFGQNNEWKEYFSNGKLSIQFIYAECHQPAKGLHNENVLLRLANNTDQDIIVSYKLSKTYNGKEQTGDTSDFTFTVPAFFKLESTCEDLKDGLHVFSKILDLKAKSVLNSFELKNLKIN